MEGFNRDEAAHLVESFYDAAIALKHCKFIADKYPSTQIEIEMLLGDENINVEKMPDDSFACGQATKKTNTIKINTRDFFKPQKDRRCPQTAMLASHELIHLAGIEDEKTVEEIVWGCL